MHSLVRYLCAIISLIIMQSCDSTEANTDPKEYVWTEEKLMQRQGIGVEPTGIWGSSPSDVWVVGFNDAHQGEIFHYNGKDWKNVDPGLSFAGEYMGIYGIDSNNVFVVGYKWKEINSDICVSPLILHYDGQIWTSQLPDDYSKNEFLRDIYGISKSSLWTVGENGLVYYYNGYSWNKITFPDTLDNYSVFSLHDGRTFVCGQYYDNYKTKDWAILYMAEFNDGSWNMLDTNRFAEINGEWQHKKFGYKDIWGTDINNLYTAGEWVHKYDNPGWTSKVWERDANFDNIHGSSRDNIFTIAEHGRIFHYNGTNWEEINKYREKTVNFRRVYVFQNDVFILAEYQGDCYIIRGSR